MATVKKAKASAKAGKPAAVGRDKKKPTKTGLNAKKGAVKGRATVSKQNDKIQASNKALLKDSANPKSRQEMSPAARTRLSKQVKDYDALKAKKKK